MSYGDKPRDWFIENGYRYDLRNHCWIRDFVEVMPDTPEPPKTIPIFSKEKNKIIFNNQQYPLKFSKVMFKT